MFKCHRVVMAAASLYIRDALSSFYNNNNDIISLGGSGNCGTGGVGSNGTGGGSSSCNNCNTVMILPTEIKMADMEAILRFIYDGHVEVKVDSIESFLRSARLLNIKGLSNVNIVFNNNGTTTTTTSNNDDSMISDNSGIEVISNASQQQPSYNSTGTNNVKNNNGFSASVAAAAAAAAAANLLNGHTVG
ncbi:hypothetical protein BLA29_002761, partial [Euroglyphus maynei]